MLEGEETAVYQCQELKNYSATVSFYTSNHKEYAHAVVGCIKSRLSWSDLDLMRAIIFVLSTRGWEKAQEEENDMQAVDQLVQRFAIPLERAGVETDEVSKEFREMITYATQYIALAVLDYHSVWWRLFHAPCSSEWTNALALAKLLFSLPASNGKLERIFSLLKIIKVNKCSLLSNESLDDLPLLNSDKLPLEKFDPIQQLISGCLPSQEDYHRNRENPTGPVLVLVHVVVNSLPPSLLRQLLTLMRLRRVTQGTLLRIGTISYNCLIKSQLHFAFLSTLLFVHVCHIML